MSHARPPGPKEASCLPSPETTYPQAAYPPPVPRGHWRWGVSRPVVGPSFQDVAAKYRGKDVEEALFDKIKNGGSGVWGQVPMPPNPQVPDPDLHAIVRWILTLK
jgi:hypothetical protein